MFKNKIIITKYFVWYIFFGVSFGSEKERSFNNKRENLQFEVQSPQIKEPLSTVMNSLKTDQFKSTKRPQNIFSLSQKYFLRNKDFFWNPDDSLFLSLGILTGAGIGYADSLR